MGTTVQLLNIDMSSCGLSREPALEVCQQMASIHGLSTLNLSNNQLNEQVCLCLFFRLWREAPDLLLILPILVLSVLSVLSLFSFIRNKVQQSLVISVYSSVPAGHRSFVTCSTSRKMAIEVS